MPGLSGLDVLQSLSERGPACACIVLSMLEGASPVARALALGARGYLAKGASAAELCTAVRAVAGGRRYLQPELVDAALSLVQGDSPDPLTKLTAREQQVMRGVCAGQTSAAIAEQLHLSAKTVETYRSRLMQKLGVDNVPALVKQALREGWISLDG
jgi:DNA-binding NarL/FixJ family response regulator